jgi:hypothetical protein
MMKLERKKNPIITIKHNLSLFELTHKTRDPSYEIKITL